MNFLVLFLLVTLLLFYFIFFNKFVIELLQKDKVFILLRIVQIGIPFIVMFTLPFNGLALVDDTMILYQKSVREISALQAKDFSVLIITYYPLMVFWALMTTWTAFTAQKKQNQILLDLKGAIIHSPSPRSARRIGGASAMMQSDLLVLGQYPDLDLEENMKLHERYLVNLLIVLLKFFASYTKREADELSINIMLNIEGKYDLGQKFIADNKHSFQHYPGQDINNYDGVLVNPPQLCTNVNSDSVPNIAPVMLPFLNNSRLPVVPGAPQALAKGESIIDDTQDIDDLYAEFSANERDAAQKYFNEHKKEMKSLLSIAVPKYPLPDDNDTPVDNVAVINIHSRKGKILNLDDIYIPTFFGIMTTLSNIISQPIDTYRNLFLENESIQ